MDTFKGCIVVLITLSLMCLFAAHSHAGDVDTTRKSMIMAATAGTNILLRNSTDEQEPSRWGKSLMVGGGIVTAFAATGIGEEQYIQDVGAIIAGIAASEVFNSIFYVSSDGRSLSVGFSF